MARITAPAYGPIMKTHPLTGQPIVPLGYRCDGRPIYPIMGGDDTVPPADGSGTGQEGSSQQPGSGDPSPSPEPTGFPPNTPLEQMNPQQREAYWKHQAQHWEGRAKGNFSQLQQLGVKSADDLAEIKRKVEQHDALEQELMSDKDKAVAQAAKEAETRAASTYLPQLVSAKLDAAAARKGISDESLASALEFVDHAKFLNDAGEVDAAKVNAFIAGIAPAKGNQPPKGPTAHRHGSSPGSGAGAPLSGREMYEARHHRNKTSA